MKQIDLTWPVDNIREYCETNDNWVLELPAHWSFTEIEQLYHRHRSADRPYLGVIVEIAADDRVSAAVLTDIWHRFGTDIAVASALATNPNTPQPLLKELAAHDNENVREHARLNLNTSSG